jgi:hypothetical protein
MKIDDVVNMLRELEQRLHTIERLVWIAVGGTSIIGGMMVFGLNYLAKKL